MCLGCLWFMVVRKRWRKIAATKKKKSRKTTTRDGRSREGTRRSTRRFRTHTPATIRGVCCCQLWSPSVLLFRCCSASVGFDPRRSVGLVSEAPISCLPDGVGIARQKYGLDGRGRLKHGWNRNPVCSRKMTQEWSWFSVFRKSSFRQNGENKCWNAKYRCHYW